VLPFVVYTGGLYFDACLDLSKPESLVLRLALKPRLIEMTMGQQCSRKKLADGHDIGTELMFVATYERYQHYVKIQRHPVLENALDLREELLLFLTLMSEQPLLL